MLNSIIYGIQSLPQACKCLYDTVYLWRSKEVVQNVLGVKQIVMGGVGAQSLIRSGSLKKEAFKAHFFKPCPLVQQIKKMTPLLGNISMVGTALTSRPMILVLSWSAKRIITNAALESIFGAHSPLHGKRLCNIIAVASFIIGLPSTVKFMYDCQFWLRYKIISLTPKKVNLPSLEDVFIAINTIAQGSFFSRKLLQELYFKKHF
jgi:hypothetical protein